MAKRSVFRDFMTVLRKHWRTETPEVRPVKESLGPMMPKASTFYAGVAPTLGFHVFLNFQHSSYAWQVGQFTINVILSKCEGAPEQWGSGFAPDEGVALTEGSYRIGSLLGGKDKWWHLKKANPPPVIEWWQPTSYDDYEVVLSEAARDVTHDVRAALVKLGVNVAAGPK